MIRWFQIFISITMLHVTISHAQWSFFKAFPNADFKGGAGCHGLAVDPEGKIWIQLYNATDSIEVASGKKKATRVIYVFKPNGKPAAFSPIKTITIAGETDTLFNSNRGLRTDHEGNILVSSFDTLYRLSYKTGNGMNKVIPQPGGYNSATLTAAAVDGQGNIFIAHVGPGNPVRIFDKNFNYIEDAIYFSEGYSRAFEVAKDGNTIYWAGYTNHAVYKYTRQDEFSLFGTPTTILEGFDAESFVWNPKSGYLWLSAGSYSDLPNRNLDIKTFWSPNTWYAYDIVNNRIVDSLKWVFNTPENKEERPRAIAFSFSGDTAYVGCFGSSDYPPVQMFVRKSVNVEEGKLVIVKGYTLSQNYPNPFNQMTKIQFSIGKAGFTTIKVYNLLGSEVVTLVNEYLTTGSHAVMFDASQVASGIYIYELRSDGIRLTKKMLVTK